ncbi:MAG: ankyrin repeat domain-containing protein [Fimbriimonadales bacterium]
MFWFEPFTVDRVRRYADEGVDILLPLGPGYYWMFRAAYELKTEILEYLLQKGRKPNEILSHSGTALWWVANSQRSKGDKVKAAALLLRYGADPNFATELEGGPLHAMHYKGDADMATYLIHHGARTEAVDGSGQTPLYKGMATLRHYRNDDGFARAGRNDAVIKALIRGGCDPLNPGPAKATPLHIAAFLGRTDLVELMLQHAPYREVRNGDVQTPLHVAALTGSNAEMVRLLLSAGADPNVLDAYGERPLEIALRKNYLELVSVLLPATCSQLILPWLRTP